MNESQAHQAILDLWEDGWDELHPQDVDDPDYVPYTYDNESFTTDALGELGAWVRVTIQHSTRRQTTMGSAPYRKWENNGRVFVQIFTPVDQGRALKSSLADDVRTVLEGKRMEDMRTHEAVTRGEAWFATGPSSEDGVWAQSTVVVSFVYTETR